MNNRSYSLEDFCVNVVPPILIFENFNEIKDKEKIEKFINMFNPDYYIEKIIIEHSYIFISTTEHNYSEFDIKRGFINNYGKLIESVIKRLDEIKEEFKNAEKKSQKLITKLKGLETMMQKCKVNLDFDEYAKLKRSHKDLNYTINKFYKYSKYKNMLDEYESYYNIEELEKFYNKISKQFLEDFSKSAGLNNINIKNKVNKI